MAVLYDKDKRELMVTCRCECENSLHIKVDKNWYNPNSGAAVAWMAYTNGNFYRDQQGVLEIFKKKVKKIWAIVRNKDIYYSDIIMNREDFEQFREFVSNVGL